MTCLYFLLARADLVIRYYDVTTNTLATTAEIGEYPVIHGSVVAFHVQEMMVGEDFNLDGDKMDTGLKVIDVLCDVN